MAAACLMKERDALTARASSASFAADVAASGAPRPLLLFSEILPRTEKPAGGGAYSKGLPKAPSCRSTNLAR